MINENEVARCVRKAVEGYFKDLDGEKPCCDMYGMVMDCVEKPLIEMVLEHVSGNQTRAAGVLDIDRVTLHNKLKRYGWSKSSVEK